MPFVREAVASLETQTFDDYEVVIQDAASTEARRSSFVNFASSPYA